MTKAPRFNYIITIHNKEHLIEQVLLRVLVCCRDGSRIYAILDGCGDRSEAIVDRLTRSFTGAPITKVITPDVHELLSINAGLRAASQEGDGFNIILQDDVLLGDFMLERKVANLYHWAGPDLGYVSFRLGANFTADAAESDDPVPYQDYVESACGHGIDGADVLMPGFFAYRTVPIKSPVCIPFRVVRAVGMFDERLAPYGHDDLEYAIRTARHGLRAGVFWIRFESDVTWGGTRTKPHPDLNGIVERNMNAIRRLWGLELARISGSEQPKNIVKVPGAPEGENDRDWKQAWEDSRSRLEQQRAEASCLRARVKRGWNKIRGHG
jgi:hypothetical protein